VVHRITLKKIGGSIGAIIPKELASRQHLAADDELFAVETADGILLTTADPIAQAALDAFAAGGFTPLVAAAVHAARSRGAELSAAND
jgi:antitoxin component of MazEF toxin-antitoxin module